MAELAATIGNCAFDWSVRVLRFVGIERLLIPFPGSLFDLYCRSFGGSEAVPKGELLLVSILGNASRGAGL